MSTKTQIQIRNQAKNFKVRSGAVAVKQGMTSMWLDAKNMYVPVTLLKIDNKIIDKKTKERDGYNAFVIGYGKETKVSKPLAGILGLVPTSKKSDDSQSSENQSTIQETDQSSAPANWSDVKYKKFTYTKLKEFRSEDLTQLNVGDRIDASYFRKNQVVDISGITLGKGFAGGMKRWNFAGLEASHGVSVSHRSSGSTGQRQDPGRTFKGKKMPGHMGAKRATVLNLEIMGHYSKDPSVIIVKGCIPGYEGSYVEIRDAVKV